MGLPKAAGVRWRMAVVGGGGGGGGRGRGHGVGRVMGKMRDGEDCSCPSSNVVEAAVTIT